MDIFNDWEFGSLQRDQISWKLERPIRFNGVEIPIRIEPQRDDPFELAPVQRQAIRDILALPPDVLEKTAPVVLQNYEVYREMIGEPELLPLAKPSDVWWLVEPDYMWVEEHFEGTPPTFFLMAECDWDPEHGLAVRFRDGKADAASQQGDL